MKSFSAFSRSKAEHFAPFENQCVTFALTTTNTQYDLTEVLGGRSGYLTFYCDVAYRMILSSAGSTPINQTADRINRVSAHGKTVLNARCETGTATLRVWYSGKRVSNAVAAVAVDPAWTAVFDASAGFTPTLDDATPTIYVDFAPDFWVSTGFEPLNLDAGVALPVWTTGAVNAVGYAADLPALTALSPGAVVTSLPPIAGTGGTYGESVGGGNHVTYQPTQLDSSPTLVFDGAAGNGLTYTGASAPVSYATGNDKALTIIVRGRFTAVGLTTGSAFGFGNSADANPFWHGGRSNTDLWQFRKRAGAAGGGTGPQAGANDTTVHTFTYRGNGTTGDQWVDATQTGTAVAQDEASLTFDRTSLGTLHRNAAPSAATPFEGRRWIFADMALNTTDIDNGKLWANTTAVYSTRPKLKVLIIGSSTAAGFGPVTSYIEWLTSIYDLELFDIAINGLETAEARATGSTQEPWAPAVLTSNNITAGLTACPNPDLVIYHVLTDVTAFDTYEAHGSWPPGTTWGQYLQNFAIPYTQEAVTAFEAAGAEVVLAVACQPSDAPVTPYALTVYTQRRTDADLAMKAAFGLQYWDRLRAVMVDSDGTALPGLLQGDNSHPTAATHQNILAPAMRDHIRERCPRSASYFYP